MWYSNSKILSYNKLFNFVVGNRGGGKTFNSVEWAVKSFLKDGKQFIYVRRYDSEFKKIKGFFSAVIKENKFPNHKLEVKGKQFFIDDKLAGYAIPLSTSQREKSSNYPDVDKIIFDEFIISKGVYHYLTNEVQVFLDFYETVARLRDVKVLFISNAITIANPYFTYFKIFPKHGSKFTTGNEWVIEMFKDEEYVEMKNNSRFGKLIKGTQYGDYAIENEFLQDNDTFIEKMHSKSIYYFTIKYMGKDYGVYRCIANGYLYFTNKPDLHCKIRYTFTTDDHNPDYIFLKTLKKSQPIKDLTYAYEIGMVRFENMLCKNIFYDIMNLI